MFYWLSHKVGMKYWNLLAKFHKNPSSINGWYGVVKVLKNALCFIMGYLVFSDFEINLYKIDEYRKYAKIVCFIWRHVTQKHISEFSYFFKCLTKWLPAYLGISDRYATLIFFRNFWQNGCRRPFWMSEIHFRSHFWPFQIDTQLYFFWKFLT